MRRLRFMFFVSIAGLLAACGSIVPEVTPTVAPTSTPPETLVAQEASETPFIQPSPSPSSTPQPTATETETETPVPSDTPTATETGTQTPTNTPTETPTATETLTPTATETATATDTPTDTLTPSQTPTGTQTPSSTPSDTPTPTNTATPTPTNTATPSPTATNTVPPSPTPIPLEDTDTPTPTHTLTATNTSLPSLTPSDTPTPTSTATNTLIPADVRSTENASILQTRAAERPTFTPVGQASPTNTITPATQDVTPTLITATPDDTGVLSTPEPSTPEVQPTASETAQIPVLTPTPFPVQQIPPTIAPESRPTFPPNRSVFSNTSTAAINFNGVPSNFIFEGQVIDGSVGLFAVNPRGGGSYIRTDGAGLLSFVPLGGGSPQRIASNPFFAGFSADSAETNKNFVSEVAWAGDGQNFAFIVAPPPGTDNINAGVYYYDAIAGRAFPVIHDCPNNGFASCDLTSNRPAANWESRDIEWAPAGSQLMMTVFIPSESRQGLIIDFAAPNEGSAEVTPEILRYDNGQWLDGERLLVSGLAPDGTRSIVGVYNLQSQQLETVYYDQNQGGVFIFDAVQRGDGQIIALGSDQGRGGVLRLYRIENGQATPISPNIGNRFPDRIRWAAGYSEVILSFGETQFAVNTRSGAIVQVITSGEIQVSSTGSAASAQPEQPSLPVPSGVIAGNRYDAGQQIRYIGEIPRNMRQAPSLNGQILGAVNPGEFVTVLAGPYEAGGYIWWLVSDARDVQGWMSTQTTDGFSFFEP